MGKAEFSDCLKFRYWLERDLEVKSEKTLLVIGLNPSTADAENNDPTIRRCIRFATEWGYGRLWVANIFAFRSTDPKGLLGIKDPVGADNDKWIKKLNLKADLTLVAWGNNGMLNGRYKDVLKYVKDPHCLGQTKLSHPRHPLYVKAIQKPLLYRGADS